MEDSAQDFDFIGNGFNGSNGIHGGTVNVGFDSILSSVSPISIARALRTHHREDKALDVEAAYKDLNEQLAKVGRKEVERRISFGRTAARN